MSKQSLPPAARSRLWQQVNKAAAGDSFRLQVCNGCDRVQYPPQEFCNHCLSDDLNWEKVSPLGKVLSWTTTHASTNQFFKGVLPFHVSMIKLDCGPVMIAYLAASCRQSGRRVKVTGAPDKSGQVVFFAAPADLDLTAEFSDILMENAGSQDKKPS